MKTLSERIKYARTQAGLTQGEIGAALKVTRNAVSLWEAGTNSPTADKIGDFALITGVSAEWLLTGGPIDRKTGKPAPRVIDELTQYVDGLSGDDRKRALALLKIGIGNTN